MSTLLLVRHGETALNSAQRYWGSTDVELGELGLEQAERLRQTLADRKIDVIFASELQRAHKTARIIAAEHEPDVAICPELNEVNFGEIEGMTFQEATEHFPDLVKLWVVGDPKMQYPGGESLGGFYERVSGFIRRLKDIAPEETALIVAHSGVLRLLMCHLLDIGRDNWWRFHLDFASLTTMETNDRGAVLISSNDIHHLKDGAETGR